MSYITINDAYITTQRMNISGVELPPEAEFKDGCGEVVVGPFLAKVLICKGSSECNGSVGGCVGLDFRYDWCHPICQQHLLLIVFVGYDVGDVPAAYYDDGLHAMSLRYVCHSEFPSLFRPYQLRFVAPGVVLVAVVAVVTPQGCIIAKDGADGAVVRLILLVARLTDASVDQRWQLVRINVVAADVIVADDVIVLQRFQHWFVVLDGDYDDDLYSKVSVAFPFKHLFQHKHVYVQTYVHVVMGILIDRK
ncbi:hypothetical protein GQX74_015574 [Glossina fuscipes]|nr:hypothetical protein GQX74_015574 [Glossina fuscipes]